MLGPMSDSNPSVPVKSVEPGIARSLFCFLGIVGFLAIGLLRLELSLHSILFLALLWTAVHAKLLGYQYEAIREFMASAITRSLPAIAIFLLIGMIIASFIHSGTIATLMYYGLNWLTPANFLPIGLLLCSVMSVATGTSWGTVGTLGIVFIGIGESLGIPLPLVAGMIVCGATFGDKLSPISDTTNLAALSAGTSLYRHIYAMLFTTTPAYLLALLLFTVIGISYAEAELSTSDALAIQQALAEHFALNPLVTLIPLVVLATLSVRRAAPEVAMASAIVAAVVIAVLYQGLNISVVLNALWENAQGSTGIDSLDALLGRGGMYSMSWTLLLALLAIALGGVLHGAGFLDSLLKGIVSRVRRTSSLIATTIVSGLLGNMAMGEAYISIILNCQLFARKFLQQGLDPALLSRSVEEGSTMTTALIPWTTAGAFYAATLGVPVLDYLPYAFFNYLNAIFAVVMAAMGIGLLRRKSG
jgi:NhaC family Na+:H+ antiporter